MLTVSDAGPGVPPEIRDRVFEPFFTTKEQDKGTGLGLATVYNVVAQHGGTTTIDDAPTGGARFTLHFPRDTTTTTQPTARAEGRSPEQNASPRSGFVLLADDDLQVRALNRRILERAGYDVLEAGDGLEAIDIAAGHPELDAAVLDVVMPGATGPEIAASLRDAGRTVPIVYCTGYSFDHLPQNEIEAGDTRVLSKPYRPEDLLERLEELALIKSN